MLRPVRIAEIVIGLREIAPAARGIIGGRFLCKQKAQIALPLLLRQCGRVSRMDEGQQLCGNGSGQRRSTVRLAQLLVNASRIAPSLPPAEDARRIGVEQRLTRRLVDIVPRHEEHLRPLRIRLCNHRPECAARLRREIFIGINKDDPIPRRTFQRSVARCGKVIRPRNLIQSSPEGYGDGARIIP